MATKIFVGNLGHGVTEDYIRPLFESYGAVAECDVLGSYGFVHMENEVEALQAIKGLNNHRLMGSSLKVELSTVATQGKKRSSQRTTKVFVGNIKPGTSSEHLRSMFEDYGVVTEADVIGNFGFVHMAEEREALAAIKALNGYKLNGSAINVELSTRDTQGQSKPGGYMPFERGRGGMSWGPARGRGRGASSSRFDPYSAPSSWMPRSDMYPGFGYSSMMAAGGEPYRASLPPPPSSSLRPAQSAGDDSTFARELLQLYSRDPEAFDAYARNPDVRRSLNLRPDSSMSSGHSAGGGAAGGSMLRHGLASRDNGHLKPPREFVMDQRPGHRMMSPGSMVADLRRDQLMSTGMRGGGAGSLRGIRPTSADQVQLYMSFE